MKRFPLLLFAGMLMSALCVAFSGLNAQTTKWDYPVKSGTPRWAAFQTHDEMVEACQIPEGILSSLTTQELVEICLNYPLFGDIFAFKSLQDGFRNNVAINFNGVQELFCRVDNVQCLLNVLKNNDLLALESHKQVLTDLEIGESIWRHSFLEVLISHEAVLANASAEQQQEIAAVASRNMLIKERGTNMYGYPSLGSSAYLLGATLKIANIGAAPSPDLEMFLETGTSRDITLLIEELVNNYVGF